MRFFRRLIVLGALFLGAAGASAKTPPQATSGGLPFVGAPRVLELLDDTGQPLRGEPSGVAWERGGLGFYFTLERGAARNIYRARPEKSAGARFPLWRARPVTTLRPPTFAFNPVPGLGDALFCLSNVGSGDGLARVCRLDWGSLLPRPLFLDAAPHADLAQSPSGALLSFTGQRDGKSTLFGAYLNSNGAPFPLAIPARGAVWLDNQTLVFQSLGQPLGLVARNLNETKAQILLLGSGELAPLGGGVGVVFSARATQETPPQLYLLGRDGSGLRAVSLTEGARRPAISPTGQSLAFDAPLEGAQRLWLAPLEGGAPLRRSLSVPAPKTTRPQSLTRSNASVSANASRPLLVQAPLSPKTTRETPVGFIESVEPGRSAQVSATGNARPLRSLLIRGTTSGPAPISVALEWGSGENPAIWNPLAVSQVPTANGPLALWTPSASAQGIYTLRLSVSARGGASQNLFRVRLPLGAGVSGAPENSQIIGREPLPPLPLPPPAPTPKPAPLPRPIPTSRPIPTLAPTPVPIPTPIPRPTVAPRPTPTPRPVPTPTPIPTPTPVYAPPLSFVARFNVSGTLARVAPGQKFPVTFWGQNLGTATWNSDNSPRNGGDSTRIVARWVDFSTGTRRKWNFFWLRTPVAPGNRTRQDLEMSAPTRPGKYKLIYGLVRVPRGGSWSAPPYNAPQETWPGEFGAIAFAVEVATVVVGEGEEN